MKLLIWAVAFVIGLAGVPAGAKPEAGTALPPIASAHSACPAAWAPYIKELDRLTSEHGPASPILFSSNSDGRVYDCLSQVTDENTILQIDQIRRQISFIQRRAQASAPPNGESSVCTTSPGTYKNFEYLVFILPDPIFPEMPLDSCLARIKESHRRDYYPNANVKNPIKTDREE